MKKPYSIVTGAANGLGKAFVLELSKMHINTILVDLPSTGLNDLCETVKTIYGTDSVCYEFDLTDKENVVNLAEKVSSTYNVNILINNAGMGTTRRFGDVDINYINRMIQLNVMAPSVLIHQLLPNLKRQEKGYILNVSSMMAFSPIGYKTVYPASKVFVHYLTRGLYQELKDTNVFVSAVYPGPMKTNADVTRRILLQGVFGKLGLMTPEKVAEKAIRRLFKGDMMILLPFVNVLNRLLMKLVPDTIKLPLLTRAVRREIDLAEHN